MKHFFDGALRELKNEVLAMFALAEGNIHRAIDSLFHRDQDGALAVMESDKKLDEMENRLDAECLKLTALNQPTGRDLRFIVGCMRLVPQLERIGDEAASIAERTLVLCEKSPLPIDPNLQALADEARSLLRLAFRAVSEPSAGLALEVLARKDRGPELAGLAVRGAVEYMLAESRAVERALQHSFAAYNLKRVCDQALNVAEIVVFIEDGAVVKHADT